MSPDRVMIGIISVVIILGVLWPLVSMVWNERRGKLERKKLKRTPRGAVYELINWLNLIILLSSPIIVALAFMLISVVFTLMFMFMLMIMLLAGIPILFAHAIQLIIQGVVTSAERTSRDQWSVPTEDGQTSGLIFGGE